MSTNEPTPSPATRRSLEIIPSLALSLSILSIALLLANPTLFESIKSLPLGSIFRFSMAGLVFLLMGGLFPLSAFAFTKMEVPYLRKQLKRDYLLLGSAQRVEDLNREQAIQADEIKDRWNSSTYVINSGLALIATLFGVGLLFLNPDWFDERTGLLNDEMLKAMRLGFFGAYIFCVNLIYRRYTTLDLQPQVYLICTVGLIAGMVFNFVAFAAITQVAPPTELGKPQFTGIGSGLAAIIAFSLGYFPNLAIRWFGRVTNSSLTERQRRSDDLPLALIDGISELHESRLKDEGIDNIQNLATTDIHNLVEKTPFTAQEIVEWVDQAVLYLYLDPGDIEVFRKLGIRSVSDFRDLCDGHGDQSEESKKVFLNAVSQQMQTTEARINSLYIATSKGPNMDCVRTYWNNLKNESVLARQRVVNQVSGRIGQILRDGIRKGARIKSDAIIDHVADALLLAESELAKGESQQTSPESLIGKAWLFQRLEKPEDAKQLYLQCIKEFPDYPGAYNDLAWLTMHGLLPQGRESREKALVTVCEYAGKAVELARNESSVADSTSTNELPAYLDTLALAQIMSGNPAEGKIHLQEAMKKWHEANPDNPQPYFLKTLISGIEMFRKLDKADQARTSLDELKQEASLLDNLPVGVSAEKIELVRQIKQQIGDLSRLLALVD